LRKKLQNLAEKSNSENRFTLVQETSEYLLIIVPKDLFHSLLLR
jgi:hypothetical protein